VVGGLVTRQEPRDAPVRREPAPAAPAADVRARRLDIISALLVERWQKELANHHAHETVMACRSLLTRILKDRRLPFNPVRDVDWPGG
jgi:hypothetical protein